MLARGGDRVCDAASVSVAAHGLSALRSGAPGRIDSVYASTVNVTTPLGLVTIAPSAAGGLPNGILADLGADLRTIGVDRGMPVVAEGEALRIPMAGVTIRWTHAVRWSPRMPGPSGGAGGAASRWHRRSAMAWAVARRVGAERGFGPLLRGDAVEGPLRGALDRARSTLPSLVGALGDGDPATAAREARSLIGLGDGLTPSGDDVLMGLEAALWALGAPTAGFLAGALQDVDERTTTVAATYLRHAAAGEFAERLHVLLAALLADGDVETDGDDDDADERAGAAIAQAVAWGATSGTDCLLGVLHGLDVGARRTDGAA